ncbi:gamma-glutamyltransferase, partial [Escherichia coli]|nr:gamma-glutamyltransferase [Escherichia coli]
FVSDLNLNADQQLTLITPQLPSSGLVITFAMNMMEHLRSKYGYDAISRDLQWHYEIEILKHAFAHRMHLGDSIVNYTVVENMKSKAYAKQ